MDWDESLTELRQALAKLYPDQDDYPRILNSAGIGEEFVKITGKGINDWHAILTEALKRQRLETILALATKEYPNDSPLKGAIESFTKWKEEFNIGSDAPTLYGAFLMAELPGAEAIINRMQRLSAEHKKLVEWKELHKLLDSIGAALGQFATSVNSPLRSNGMGDPKYLVQGWRPVNREVNIFLESAPDFIYIEPLAWFEEIASLRDGINEMLNGQIPDPPSLSSTLVSVSGSSSEEGWQQSLAMRTRLLEDRIKVLMSLANRKLIKRANALSVLIGIAGE
jgi:hypothetical protein